MKGETFPHCDGGQLALGSGNTLWAETPDQKTTAAANAILLFILDLLVLTWNKVGETPRMGVQLARESIPAN